MICSREALANASNRSGLSISERIDAAICWGEEGGTNNPVTPSMIKSLAPGISVTIQGTEQAIASRTTLGEASRCEGSINNWDVTRKEMASERCPRKWICALTFDCWANWKSFSPYSPTIVRCTRGSSKRINA